MSEEKAASAYLRMLEEVAVREGDIGPRLIASHWPFVGSDYRRLLVVGQALAGWDDKSSPALWTADRVRDENGRRVVLDETQAWARSQPEPMWEVLRFGHRAGSPFWTLSKQVVKTVAPDGDGEWYSRHAWWNLFPLGWGDTNQSPTGPLWLAQIGHFAELFWEIVDFLDPTRIVILAGKDYWWHVAGPLGLHDLTPLERPLISAGLRDGRAIVATYHPGARLKSVRRAAFAESIGKTLAGMAR